MTNYMRLEVLEHALRGLDDPIRCMDKGKYGIDEDIYEGLNSLKALMQKRVEEVKAMEPNEEAV
jgi:hypothetical protein